MVHMHLLGLPDAAGVLRIFDLRKRRLEKKCYKFSSELEVT